MKRLLDLLDGALSRIETVVIAAFALGALALGTAQVVMRYVFNTGYTWSEAIFVLLTVWAMLFGGVRAVRDDAHVKVDIVPQLLPRRAQKVMRLVRYAAALALTAVFFYAGLKYVAFTRQMEIVSPTAQIPVWVIYLVVPITMGGFALRYIILILREGMGEDTGHTEAEEAVRLAMREEHER